MPDSPAGSKGRARRVRKNLRQGMGLAWAASPRALIRYSILGMLSAAMPPVAVYLGATLVNRIAEARLHSLQFKDLIPILVGLWLATAVQRAVGAYMGYGRNLFVRRVQLEAERRLLAQASKVDIGHFDNSDWHDRLARAKRDVSWRPGDLTWSVLGLSGNVVTVILMAGLLASLHWVLVDHRARWPGAITRAGTSRDLASLLVLPENARRAGNVNIWRRRPSGQPRSPRKSSVFSRLSAGKAQQQAL